MLHSRPNITALIVDDEVLARNELTRLLKSHKHVNIIAEAENISQAKELIEKHNPDVIFLDIEMPGGTGIELAEQLGGETHIIFCTAYNEFAVDAFSLNAVDYLLKPIVKNRLESTLAKLAGLLTKRPVSYLEDDFKLMVKFSDNMKIIQLADILRFESIGNHAAIYTAFGKAYIHSSLSKIEARLNPDYFLRASRSDIIRLDAITELEETINYGLLAKLSNGAEVEISRRQASKLKQQLSFNL
ncbi:LytR/AlgR family response regulator transcription factor [Pseudoalteromonas prydzensis]|nr:LytTR family DNA-binding domain-containing protein [Pseudoalteromonas prydzensis]MBE0376969.1 two-component system, LytT family, response regulator [Pseudoalteromonas prydzensis ACAM 620]